MERIRASGCPLLSRALVAALLLLTGLQVEAQTAATSSQSTQEINLSATHVSPELTVSIGDTSTMTPSETLATNVVPTEPESKVSTQHLEKSTLSDNFTVSANPATEVSSTNVTNSSASIQTTVTPLNTTVWSANPNSTVLTNTTSISTVSKPSTPQTSENTKEPRTGTVTSISQTDTGSTNQMGLTGSTNIATKDDNMSTTAVTQEASHSSETKASPTYSESSDLSAFTTASKIQMSTADETTEHQDELPKALSSGSVAAITIIVIVLVLVIFGGAAYWKIRHSSYGRLLEDQDYGSLGNYNNPLYDDS